MGIFTEMEVSTQQSTANSLQRSRARSITTTKHGSFNTTKHGGFTAKMHGSFITTRPICKFQYNKARQFHYHKVSPQRSINFTRRKVANALADMLLITLVNHSNFLHRQLQSNLDVQCIKACMSTCRRTACSSSLLRS